MKLDEIAAALEQSVDETQKTLDELVGKGFVRRIEVKGEWWYKAKFGRKADKTLHQSVWSALDGLVEQEKKEDQ
jgi:predicted transcriptional regulator